MGNVALVDPAITAVTRDRVDSAATKPAEADGVEDTSTPSVSQAGFSLRRRLVTALLLVTLAVWAVVAGFWPVGMALVAVATVLVTRRSATDRRAGEDADSVQKDYEAEVGRILAGGALDDESLSKLEELDRSYAGRVPERGSAQMGFTGGNGSTPKSLPEAAVTGGVVVPLDSSVGGRVAAYARVERLYSPKDAAKYLQVHVSTIRGWVRSGRLPAKRLTGSRRIRIAESAVLGMLEPTGTDSPRKAD